MYSRHTRSPKKIIPSEREEQFFCDEKMIRSQIAEDDRYSTLIKTAFESIAISVDGIIVEAHEDFARTNGYELFELIGRHVTDFLVLEEHERALRTLRSSEECMGEFSALKKDGSTFAVEAHGRIIKQRWETCACDGYTRYH